MRKVENLNRLTTFLISEKYFRFAINYGVVLHMLKYSANFKYLTPVVDFKQLNY